MAVPKAGKKPASTTSTEPNSRTTETKLFAQAGDQTTRLQLYVKDKRLVKELKLAALEDDVSISQLFEQWATDWLESRRDS